MICNRGLMRNTLTRENNWFLNVLVKSNFAPPTPFGSVSCFVVGFCLSNYNLNSFLIHQASYSKEYQRYLMQRENLGSIWKIGRYPIKVSEVLSHYTYCCHLMEGETRCSGSRLFENVTTACICVVTEWKWVSLKKKIFFFKGDSHFSLGPI